MRKEAWHGIRDYEGLYQVSNLGKVKSLKRKVWDKRGYMKLVKERVLKPNISTGYYLVSLYKEGKAKKIGIARLVAQVFIENSNDLPETNHKDGNKRNNCVRNLEWVTGSENIIHAFRLGLRKPSMSMLGRFGKEHPSSKAVLQFDLKGNFIFKYESVLEAKKETGICNSSIGKVCKGKLKTAGNYIWKYPKAS